MGAGLIGCETALYLAKKGKQVTIAGGRRLAHDMIWGNALDLIKLLDDHHVRILTNQHVRKITEAGADSANQHFDADSFVLAVGMKSNNEIPLETLTDKIPEVYTIGDCVGPRHVLSAIWEGYRTAYLM
jgi:2-enoate reductase